MTRVALRQSVEPAEQRVAQEGFAAGLVGALDRNLRLDDGHQPVRRDLTGNLELLGDDRRDARLRCAVDHRAHLGAEDAKLDGALEQGVEAGYRLHQGDAVLLGLEPLVDLEEWHDAALFPQEGRHRLAFRFAVHGAFEQDGGNHLGAGEGRRRHDAHAHVVHHLEHLGLIAVPGTVRDAVGAQRARRRAATLVERSDEAWLGRYLLGHRVIGHDHSPALARLF